MKHVVSLVLIALFMGLLSLPVFAEELSPVYRKTVLEISGETALEAKGKVRLTAKAYIETSQNGQQVSKVPDEEFSSSRVVWLSENTKCATVDRSGNVTGVDEGKTKIYAVYNDCAASVDVSVTGHAECDVHDWDTKITKATPSNDGKIERTCKVCGKKDDTEIIYAVNDIYVASTTYYYDGRAKTPKVTVRDSDGNTVSASDYRISYNNNVNAGTANAVVTLSGDKYEGSVTKNFRINKASNHISVRMKSFKIKRSAVKKKNKKYAVSKYLTISKKKGTLSFKKTSGNKKILIDSKTGKMTIKKGIKKGSYIVGLRVKDSGNQNYTGSEKNVNFIVTVAK